MFGVNLKYHFPFNAALIGTGVAASVAVYFRVMAFSIGVGGIPGLLSIQTESVKYFILSILIAMIVPFTLTYIIGKKKTANSTTTSNEKFISPLEGSLLKLSEIDDQVFSQGLMGDGFAVELESSEVISPFDGEVVMTFPTKHAYGLKSNDGLEVLIHLGMDTVALNGVGFECFVKVGEKIKQGQLLVKVDLEYIKSQQKSLVSPVIFTSGEKINLLALEKVKLAQKVIEMK